MRFAMVRSPLVDHLTFMNGCMVRVPFRELVPAVSAAGFEAMTCWANVWRHALTRDGFDLPGMRALLDDNGIALTDCEVCRTWAPSAAESASGKPLVAADPHEILSVCAALGGSTVVAIHDTPDGLVLDRDAEAFAALCDAAAEHGLRVALETVPFTTIRDVASGWSLVEAAGRPNGGLVFDVWHHVRSGCPDSALDQVPGSRIFTIQLSDGPAYPRNIDLMAEASTPQGRMAPGAGEMPVSRLLSLLRAKGVVANVGPEVTLTVDGGALDRERAEALARELHQATTSTLAAADARSAERLEYRRAELRGAER